MSKERAEDALYHDLRDETNEKLHSILVQKAIKDVTSTMLGLKELWKTESVSQSGMLKRMDNDL